MDSSETTEFSKFVNAKSKSHDDECDDETALSEMTEKVTFSYGQKKSKSSKNLVGKNHNHIWSNLKRSWPSGAEKRSENVQTRMYKKRNEGPKLESPSKELPAAITATDNRDISNLNGGEASLPSGKSKHFITMPGKTKCLNSDEKKNMPKNARDEALVSREVTLPLSGQDGDPMGPPTLQTLMKADVLQRETIISLEDLEKPYEDGQDNSEVEDPIEKKSWASLRERMQAHGAVRRSKGDKVSEKASPGRTKSPTVTVTKVASYSDRCNKDGVLPDSRIHVSPHHKGAIEQTPVGCKSVPAQGAYATSTLTGHTDIGSLTDRDCTVEVKKLATVEASCNRTNLISAKNAAGLELTLCASFPEQSNSETSATGCSHFEDDGRSAGDIGARSNIETGYVKSGSNLIVKSTGPVRTQSADSGESKSAVSKDATSVIYEDNAGSIATCISDVKKGMTTEVTGLTSDCADRDGTTSVWGRYGIDNTSKDAATKNVRDGNKQNSLTSQDNSLSNNVPKGKRTAKVNVKQNKASGKKSAAILHTDCISSLPSPGTRKSCSTLVGLINESDKCHSGLSRQPERLRGTGNNLATSSRDIVVEADVHSQQKILTRYASHDSGFEQLTQQSNCTGVSEQDHSSASNPYAELPSCDRLPDITSPSDITSDQDDKKAPKLNVSGKVKNIILWQSCGSLDSPASTAENDTDFTHFSQTLYCGGSTQNNQQSKKHVRVSRRDADKLNNMQFVVAPRSRSHQDIRSRSRKNPEPYTHQAQLQGHSKSHNSDSEESIYGIPKVSKLYRRSRSSPGIRAPADIQNSQNTLAGQSQSYNRSSDFVKLFTAVGGPSGWSSGGTFSRGGYQWQNSGTLSPNYGAGNTNQAGKTKST